MSEPSWEVQAADEQAQFQKVRYGERFARDLGVRLHRIEGAEHFIPEDHPDVIADEIRGLVATSPHPPAASEMPYVRGQSPPPGGRPKGCG